MSLTHLERPSNQVECNQAALGIDGSNLATVRRQTNGVLEGQPKPMRTLRM